MFLLMATMAQADVGNKAQITNDCRASTTWAQAGLASVGASATGGAVMTAGLLVDSPGATTSGGLLMLGGLGASAVTATGTFLSSTGACDQTGSGLGALVGIPSAAVGVPAVFLGAAGIRWVLAGDGGGSVYSVVPFGLGVLGVAGGSIATVAGLGLTKHHLRRSSVSINPVVGDDYQGLALTVKR